MHLSHLLHQMWNTALDSKNQEERSLEELTGLVLSTGTSQTLNAKASTAYGFDPN